MRRIGEGEITPTYSDEEIAEVLTFADSFALLSAIPIIDACDLSEPEKNDAMEAVVYRMQLVGIHQEQT